MRSDVQLVPGPPPFAASQLRAAGQRTGDTFETGAIAQLGERVLCKHEVVGSIPIGSTILRCCAASDGRPEVRSAATNTNDGIISFSMRYPRMPRIFDIVKAGLAGSHNRLIHTTLKTDRK